MNARTISRLQAHLADRFVIDRELGRGGMGVVFQARDKALGRQVAIKLVDGGLTDLSASSFRREIKFTARLQHPHILPLLETGEIDGQAYYVMPYVKGGSLRGLMNSEGPLPVSRVLRVAQEVGSALETAHESKIVHCDIKPENVLISNGFAVLADFGIARSMLLDGAGWRKTDYGSLGSPVYLSPEQASGEHELDARSDVYSLACVVYEMLSGIPPFEGKTVEAVVAKRFTDTPMSLHAIRDNVSQGLSRAVARAMELDPRDRFASVSHFIRAMETAVAIQRRAGVSNAKGFFGQVASLLHLIPGRRATPLAH